MPLHTIVHLTSAHPRSDTRVFHKMCCSLASAGFQVHLVVADGVGNSQTNGVTIWDVGSERTRLARMLRIPRRVLACASAIAADVYHLHDPELVPIGLALKKLGKRVVFDSHEDVPKSILSKHYLPRVARSPLAWAWATYESWAFPRLDGLIAATPSIAHRIGAYQPRTATVCNYPILSELSPRTDWGQKENAICYVGGISRARGIIELVHALRLSACQPTLYLAGQFREPGLREQAMGMPGWSLVRELGQIDRLGVRSVLERSRAGAVTLHGTANHLDSLPIKMFEYMAAGIPVIASHFPLWREIVSSANCGVLVDPHDPQQIARAMDSLLQRPAEARAMGASGRQAIEARFNWDQAAVALNSFYHSVETRTG